MISSTMVSILNITLVMSDLFAKSFTRSLDPNPDSLKIAKKIVLNIDSCYSISIFFVTLSLISSIEV